MNPMPRPYNLNRRRAWLLGACVAAAAALPMTPVDAQSAAAPLRLVVPFAAGTTTDNVARVVGNAIGPRLGQVVVVDNRPGAGGSIATDQVAKSLPDGRTLVMGTVGTHAINATLFRKLPYDAVRDFEPVAFVGHTPLLLLVSAHSGLKTPQDLIRLARRDQGITFASAGNGTAGHLAGELLARQGGRMIHVPYKDGAQALTDLMAGNVDFMFYHPTAAMQHLGSGKLRALGTSSSARSALVPDAAPLAEQGVAGFDLVAWLMLYAPARTPPEALARLRASATAALNEPEARQRLQAQGIETSRFEGERLRAFTAEEVGKWAALVRQSGAQVD